MNTYHTAKTSAVFLDRSDRVRLEIAGPDRAKFLNNLTTNDIKRLPAGQGIEAFVTSPQGKTIGFVIVTAEEDRILLRADRGGMELVLPHLRKYGVFDEVEIDDISNSTFEYHLAGPDAEPIIDRTFHQLPEPGGLRHVAIPFKDGRLRLIRESPFGLSGYTLIGGVALAPGVRAALNGSGVLVEFDHLVAEAFRIEAGTPIFGRDVSAENLPQEVARDDRAINFVKGCYLGQETVARLDALGHVNKILRGFRIAITEAAETLRPGAVIEADGKPLGKITSAAFSEGWGCQVALGYVRTSHAAAGTEVLVDLGDRKVKAVVSAWPMTPPDSLEKGP